MLAGAAALVAIFGALAAFAGLLVSATPPAPAARIAPASPTLLAKALLPARSALHGSVQRDPAGPAASTAAPSAVSAAGQSVAAITWQYLLLPARSTLHSMRQPTVSKPAAKPGDPIAIELDEAARAFGLLL